MLPTTKILIVEDEPILANNLKSFLCRWSADVRIASNAVTAIEAMQDFTPELVLIDYGLPGMDGLQAYARILHRRAPQASFVMIIGQLTAGIARSSSDYGIRHVLRKPFSFAELESVIEQSLDDGPVPAPNLNGILKRILSTRRLGLGTLSSLVKKPSLVIEPLLTIEQSEALANNRRQAERRLSLHRRHDDVPDGLERRT